MTPLLEVKNLKTSFTTSDGRLWAIDDLSLKIFPGETCGLVGESGCGKSVTALSLLRLIQRPGKIESGQILFSGQDLMLCSEEEMRHVRGNQMAMIFQDPMTSLNPVFTCGQQIQEVIQLHKPTLSSAEQKQMTLELLSKVGLSDPERRYDEYPHQLSGGMRQRIMIAMAMSCSPQLLIADEPTTALDVTIQAQILDLLKKLKTESSLSMILITHDLGVVAEICQSVAVMYAGKIVEKGPVEDIFYRPLHPYTQGLLRSIPRFDPAKKGQRLKAIPGMVPSLNQWPSGCRFFDRCSRAQTTCQQLTPELRTRSDQSIETPTAHQVACHFPGGIDG